MNNLLVTFLVLTGKMARPSVARPARAAWSTSA